MAAISSLCFLPVFRPLWNLSDASLWVVGDQVLHAEPWKAGEAGDLWVRSLFPSEDSVGVEGSLSARSKASLGSGMMQANWKQNKQTKNGQNKQTTSQTQKKYGDYQRRRGWGEVEEGQEGMLGDGRRRGGDHNTICRWCIIELCTWNIILLTVTLINSLKKKRGGGSNVPLTFLCTTQTESSGLLPFSQEPGDTLRAVTPRRKTDWKRKGSVMGNNFQSSGSLSWKPLCLYPVKLMYVHSCCTLLS